MTDDQTDAWFLVHAEYTVQTANGVATFILKRRDRSDQSVGFMMHETMPLPQPTDVKRFLARWFVSAYGDS